MPTSRAEIPQPDPPRGTPWPIRPIEKSEFPAYHELLHGEFSPTSDRERGREGLGRVMEFDRALAAFDTDGTTLIGTASAFSFTMTLPGGPSPVAGVATVAVRSTHRRRGVLTSLMRRQLADIRDRGEAVAALYASESGIYGRFGYGAATRKANLTLHRGETALRSGVPRDPALRLRTCQPAEARKELGMVRATAAGRRVGEVARGDAGWDQLLADPEDGRYGYSALRCVVAEDDAGPLGYALYRVRPRWSEHALPEYTLKVSELHANDPAAYVMLWEYLAGLDLVDTILMANRPPDEPLFHLLADQRRTRAILTDALWVRLVDVGRALERRAYPAPVDVVIEVADATCPWNEGRWRLAADTRAARCERTDREPDLHLDVASLGAAYLGETRLGSHAAAGLVREYRDGAVAELSTALGWPLHPHCSVEF